MTLLADRLEATLLEHGPRSACRLAMEVRRRKTDVLAALRDPRFRRTGKGRASQWDVVPPRSFDAEEAAERWLCSTETAGEIVFGPEGFLERGFVASLNGNGRVVVTELGLAMAGTLEGAA